MVSFPEMPSRFSFLLTMSFSLVRVSSSMLNSSLSQNQDRIFRYLVQLLMLSLSFWRQFLLVKYLFSLYMMRVLASGGLIYSGRWDWLSTPNVRKISWLTVQSLIWLEVTSFWVTQYYTLSMLSFLDLRSLQLFFVQKSLLTRSFRKSQQMYPQGMISSGLPLSYTVITSYAFTKSSSQVRVNFYQKQMFLAYQRWNFSRRPLSCRIFYELKSYSLRLKLTFLLVLGLAASQMNVSVILLFTSYRKPTAFLTSMLQRQREHILSRYSNRLRQVTLSSWVCMPWKSCSAMILWWAYCRSGKRNVNISDPNLVRLSIVRSGERISRNSFTLVRKEGCRPIRQSSYVCLDAFCA